MRKNINILVFLPIMFSLACSGNRANEAPAESEDVATVVKVILDTDMDSDIDDVAAMGLLHHFADLGEVEILATVSCSANKYAVEVVDAINTFFDRPDIPVAAPDEGAPQHGWILRGDILAGEFSHDASVENSPSATELYRKTLASQPDSSVVIISLGYLNNLNDLLLSGPDEYSPLSGAELVAKKVQSYYCMGGSYPADQIDPAVKYGNFRPDVASTAYVVENWPTRLVFTGGGEFAAAIKHGNGLKTLSENHIVRRAYELAKGDASKDWGHHSADILTVWMAVRGTGSYFQETTFGYNEIDQYGRNVWKADHDQPNRSYVSDLSETTTFTEVAAMFDSYLSKLSRPGAE